MPSRDLPMDRMIGISAVDQGFVYPEHFCLGLAAG